MQTKFIISTTMTVKNESDLVVSIDVLDVSVKNLNGSIASVEKTVDENIAEMRKLKSAFKELTEQVSRLADEISEQRSKR